MKTATIWEHLNADESHEEVANSFGLSERDVRWAEAYENSAQAAVKPAEVRFYFDADILGVAKILASLRLDVTYPGDPGIHLHKRDRPACPIDPETDDEVWIPDVNVSRLAYRHA